MFDNLPNDSVGLRLARINRKGELILCEKIHFENGRAAVHTLLRRAAISGRVEIEGEIADHFADVMDKDGDIVTTVSLDSKSYSVLKNRWMRCKIQPQTP
jgi:hypothetical protein